eukprot:TRINITY_DN3071_c0_g1_i2.p4 TRINITY_DN3071_c0_g1~~TRINITY_DN3071_c0_g1_i2.p4  ORF type:complete len:124 (-),score=21.88 TRINITY_DN3071_c0_g1_i2:599-970(-)
MGEKRRALLLLLGVPRREPVPTDGEAGFFTALSFDAVAAAPGVFAVEGESAPAQKSFQLRVVAIDSCFSSSAFLACAASSCSFSASCVFDRVSTLVSSFATFFLSVLFSLRSELASPPHSVSS